MPPHLLQNLEAGLMPEPQIIQYFFSKSEVEEGLLAVFSPYRPDMAPVGLKVSSTSGRKSGLLAGLEDD